MSISPRSSSKGLEGIFVQDALDERYPCGVVVRVCGRIPDERLMELHIERVRYSTAGQEIEWRRPEDEQDRE
jgi:hypothetical protein